MGIKKVRHMQLLIIIIFVLGAVSACQQKQSSNGTVTFSTPRSGALVAVGDSIRFQMDVPKDIEIDSVQYYINDSLVGTAKNNLTVSAKISTNQFGRLLLSAHPYIQGESQKIISNVIVVPDSPPAEYSFSVINTFPHDPQAYTQGLELNEGVLYESTGEYGQSSIRKVNLRTGEVVKKIALPDEQFGEGLTIVGDKLIQLTWREGIGIVYNKHTLEKIKTFPYQSSKEGWGLCFDGERLIKSDGSNRLYFLDKDTYQETGYVEVYNDKGPVDSINELEFIDGKVYANIYTTDYIVIINPESGRVEGQLNLIGLLPQSHQTPETNVLNGIAYDKNTSKLYVTGKNWDTLFEIQLIDR